MKPPPRNTHYRSLLRYRHWLLPCAVSLCIGWFILWAGGTYSVDTGLYAGVSRAAYYGDPATGETHFWTLTRGDEPYFNKPPLVFWIHGACMRVFGTSDYAARAPGSLAMVLCTLATVVLARQFVGRKAAMLAGLVFALTFDQFRWTIRFVLDHWTVLFILCWLIPIAWASRPRPREDTQPRPLWPVMLAGVPLGLSLLCKPIFALVGVPIVCVWIAVARTARPAQLIGAAFASAIVAIIVAAPWHLSMMQLHGDAFTSVYFGAQTIERAGGGQFDAEPWWWYAQHLLQTYWPWALCIAAAALVWVRRGGLTPDGRAERLALVWCAIWLLLATFAFADKRERYIMHLYPIAAIPIGIWLARFAPVWLRRSGHGSLERNLLILCAALLIAGPTLGPVVRGDDQKYNAIINEIRHIRDTAGATRLYCPPGTFNRNERGIIAARTGLWPLPHESRGSEPSAGMPGIETPAIWFEPASDRLDLRAGNWSVTPLLDKPP